MRMGRPCIPVPTSKKIPLPTYTALAPTAFSYFTEIELTLRDFVFFFFGIHHFLLLVFLGRYVLHPFCDIHPSNIHTAQSNGLDIQF
jgi:hypothetical protein